MFKVPNSIFGPVVITAFQSPTIHVIGMTLFIAKAPSYYAIRTPVTLFIMRPDSSLAFF